MAARDGVDYAALKEKALELARQGYRSRAISRKLGVGRTTVHTWLKECGTEPIVTDTTEQRKEALRLAYMGVQPAIIAKRVGVTKNTAYKWLREAGFDTSREAECSLPCPDCGGRMKKQELFFWKCDCGAEWWPPEDMVPENPDNWTTEARLNVDPGAVMLIRLLLDEGKSYPEIAAALNQAGYKPAGSEYDRANPGEWTEDAVAMLIFRRRLKGTYQAQRQRVLQIVKDMVCAGHNCREIADRLNVEGLRTRKGQPFDLRTVRTIVVETLNLGDKLRYGAGGMPRVKLPERMKIGPHPWRRDEDARQAILKAWRRKHALSDMQGGDDSGR